MAMKKTGIVIILIGIALTIFSSLNLRTEERVVEVGDFEITREKDNELTWPRWVGVAVIAGGVVVFFLGARKK
jgi:uncharacterized membrane protein YdcZ (DUF606 family)